jgi:ABC-type antimicrobial peptide transport system permease subunit
VIGLVASDGPFALSDGFFRHGPGLILAVATLIVAMGLIACAYPLRRALRIQPTEALREG